MFRIIITKVPPQKVKVSVIGTSSLYRAFRHYSNKQPICPPKPPPPKRKISKLTYVIGAVALVGGGTIYYTKQDPEFRIWLNDNVPYSDEFLKFLFQEDRSYFESFLSFLDSIKASFIGLLGSSSPSKTSKAKSLREKDIEYTPPSPAFNALAKEKKDKEEVYAEIRIEHKDKGSEPSVTVGGEQKPPTDLPETHPKNIVQLEAKIGESAKATVLAYNKAVYALKSYNADVEIIVEDSVDRLDSEIWSSLREKTKAKEKTLKEAEYHSKQTTDDIKKLKELLQEPNVDAPDVVKKQVEGNIHKVMEDIELARKELERERRKSSVTEKYWKKVEEARTHFIDEIEILFPDVNINDRRLQLEGPELDLFILHAFAKVLFYQKELFRLQTIESDKVKSAIDSARRGNPELLTDVQIEKLVENEKKCLEDEYNKKCLCLRLNSEKDLRMQLKLQSEAFSDHLRDALHTKEAELSRIFTRQLDEKVNEEKCRYKLELSALAGRVQGMDKALKDQLEAGKSARQAQVLWSACQALFRSLRSGCPGLPWTEQLRPLEPELRAVKQAAASGDELVGAVLAGIPKEAVERGVFPEDALRERFLNVEKICRQVSLVPDGGARLPVHLLSYIQSLLLLNIASPIPQAELDDEAIDFRSLTTNEILQRARYWLDRGDFTQTLKYMNLLDGAPRCVARQWMDETRILLETQQAANTLMAHAAANGLMYL